MREAEWDPEDGPYDMNYPDNDLEQWENIDKERDGKVLGLEQTVVILTRDCNKLLEEKDALEIMVSELGGTPPQEKVCWIELKI